MVRTVKVELEADTGKYVPPVEKAKESTRSFKEQVKDTDDKLQKIPPDAVKAAAALKLLGAEADSAGRKMQGVGENARSMRVMDDAIAHTRGEVRRLADEFDRTGNTTILPHLFKAQDDLKQLEGFRDRIGKALGLGGESGGEQASANFVKSFRSTLLSGGGAMVIGPAIASLIALAVASAGGVALAGVGVGALALGIIGQLKNPAIKKAAGEVGNDVVAALGTATASFEQPMISALHTLGDAAKKVFASIDFGTLAKELEPLVSGIGALVTNMMPGFNKALAAAMPIVDTLAADLPLVGDALSQMFDDMSKGGRGAQEGLHVLMATLAGLILMIGKVVEAGGIMTERIVAAGERISWWASALTANVPVIGKFTSKIHDMWQEIQGGSQSTVVAARAFHTIGDAAAYTSDQLGTMIAAMEETKNTVDTAAAALSKTVFDHFMSVDQAVLSVDQSLTQLSDSFKQNGKSIDEHTAKGQANVQAIYGAVTANMALYQAQIASGMSATDAAANYDTNTQALERQLRKAGLTQGAIDGLIGKYAAVPDTVNTDLTMRGVETALNNLGNLIAKVNNLDGRDFGFTVTETDVRRQVNEPGNFGHVQRWGGITEHAAAGLLSAKIYSPMGPARYAFAEPATGGEAFVPRFGDYRRSTGILDQASRWYGGRFAPGGMGGGGSVVTVPITINAGMGADGYALGRQIAEVLRPYVNSKGGNVQVALGR